MKIGERSIIYNDVRIVSTSSIVGPDENTSVFREDFDIILDSDSIAQKSYEKAECLLHSMAIQQACKHINILPDDLDVILGGDLLNQICSSTFAARKINSGFLGLYGACSTFGEALLVGSMLIDSQGFSLVSCSTSSHFSTAERQYRYPLELGTQPTPTSQRTITGAGATILSNQGKAVAYIRSATIGKVVDYKIVNPNNMGAVMAPAAADTLKQHLHDMNRTPDYYDLILTGDLGKYGKSLMIEVCKKDGIFLGDNYDDGGAMYFGDDETKVQGGSGAGCINTVFNSYIIKKMKRGELKKVLVLPTGALLSKDSNLQGESIPGICYAVSVEV